MNFLPTLLAEVTPPTVAITAEMLQPIPDAVTSNLAIILPIGIAVFGILTGIKLIPRVVKWFLK